MSSGLLSMNMMDKESKLPSTTPIQPEYSIADPIANSSMKSAVHLDKYTSHSSTEMQVIISILTQLSKDVTNNQQQVSLQINQLSSQIDHLSSRIDNIATRSRSRSGSRRSSQHHFVTSENSKLHGLSTTIESIEDETNDRSSLREERVQRESFQHDKIQSSPQADELEKSLNRIHQERLSKTNLVHSERTTLPVLSYKHYKMEDSDPLVIPSLSFEVEHVIAPQQSKPIDVDIEDADAVTSIYEHRERIRKSDSVPIQQVVIGSQFNKLPTRHPSNTSSTTTIDT